jgi:hypothetical protein
MSIEKIEGDLLDFPAGINLIIHCANCQATMGSGIAKKIKEKYPQVYEADLKAHKDGEAQLGLFSYADVGDNKKIVSLYGQEFYGKDYRHLNYEGFYSGLLRVKLLLEDAYKEGRNYVVGIPENIGCVNAGGSWLVVQAMIIDLFQSSPIKIVIVKYKEK